MHHAAKCGWKDLPKEPWKQSPDGWVWLQKHKRRLVIIFDNLEYAFCDPRNRNFIVQLSRIADVGSTRRVLLMASGSQSLRPLAFVNGNKEEMHDRGFFAYPSVSLSSTKFIPMVLYLAVSCVLEAV